MPPFESIWNYFRQRTKNAVLAGFHDALDIVDQGDGGEAQHQAAAMLRARVKATVTPQLEHSVRTAEPQPEQEESPQVQPASNVVDEAIDARLDAKSSPQPTTQPTPTHQARPDGGPPPFTRKRGRPRKDQAK